MPDLGNISVSEPIQDTEMACDLEEMTRYMSSTSQQTTAQLLITLSAIVLFVGTKSIYTKIRHELAMLSVVVVGAGPVGITSALIAVQCKRVSRVIIYEEETKSSLENRSYQIAVQPDIVAFLRSYGVDFDNLEGLWQNGVFYTRVGIYLEYIITILPFYGTEVIYKFKTKFCRQTCKDIDNIQGRLLVVCCDGCSGQASFSLGVSDEFTYHQSGVYGAVASLERKNKTLVPTPERRVHNLSFDLTAYGACNYDDIDDDSQFSMKLFGNSRVRYIALAVHKNDSKILKSLKTILDKSMMRNIFMKCFNTYKDSSETSISDSYCLNNMKYSPRLFEIKVSKRVENVAYIADSDIFVVHEGEAARSYNFNTGMDLNVAMKGLAALEPFILKIALADSEHSIMKALIYKMEHSDKISKDFLKYGLREYIFL